MRHVVDVSVVVGLLAGFSRLAIAQEPALPVPAESAAPPATAATPAPVSVPPPAPARAPFPQNDGEPPGAAAATLEAGATSSFFAGIRLGLEARSGDVAVEGSESGPGSTSSTTVHYTGHQKVPLTVDIGGRLSPNVTLAGYGRVAAVLGGQIDTSWSVGAVLGVLPAPAASACPWIAVAIGYQSLGASATMTGLEISPQFGLLFRVGHLTLGPIAELILVDYSASESLCSNCSGWNAWGSLALRVGWM